MTGERPGIFVTLDGLGGAGKTTTVAHLRCYLTERGYPVYATTEPSHAPLGEIARHQTDTYSGHALACLVAADRYHHLATDIRPNLDAGTIVTRFEAGIDNSRTEADLYRDTVERLVALGYPLLTIDTSEVQPEHVAAHIGTRIASLAGVHGLSSAAE